MSRNLYLLLAIVTLCFSACNSQPEQAKTPVAKEELKEEKAVPEVDEDWLLDTIMSLREVRDEADEVRKQSNGERELSAVVHYYDSTEHYYLVKVWEDNGFAYATHFNFNYYPETKEILYYDTVSDSLFSLKDLDEIRHRYDD